MPRPGILDLTRGSLAFARKHTALWWATLWLFILPSILMTLVLDSWENFREMPSQTPTLYWTIFIGVVLALALLCFLMSWGCGAVFLIAKRQIQNRAGRSRTSFKTLRKESFSFAIPIFLTSLLRLCFIAYLALLFVVPAALYITAVPNCNESSDVLTDNLRCFYPLFLFLPLLLPAIYYTIRTTFYAVAIVTDESAYREALDRSREVTSGKLRAVISWLLGLGALIFLPAFALELFIGMTLDTMPHPMVLNEIIGESLTGIALLIFLLSLVSLYGNLRGTSGDINVLRAPHKKRPASIKKSLKISGSTITAEATGVREIMPPPAGA